MKTVIISALFLVSIFTSSTSFALTEKDVQDYNEASNTGCLSKTPVSKNADVYFVCKSKQSTEIAWQAAMHRAKVACDAEHINVLFNVSPEVRWGRVCLVPKLKLIAVKNLNFP